MCRRKRGPYSSFFCICTGLGKSGKTGILCSGCSVCKLLCSFNLINQLSVNRCPLMTLAFPVNIFQKAGIIFNESLNVTEDWEYFMRTAFFYAAFPILKHRQQSTDSGKTLKHLPPCMIRKIGMQRIILYKETYNSQNIILPAGNIRRIIELPTAGAAQKSCKCQWRNGKSTFLQ